MGKNVHGGAGHKKFARKNNGGGDRHNAKLRTSTDECEKYAIAVKMLGNNMFTCHCEDGVTRLAYIRGKFSGKRKRDNLVVCGKWVLVGLRTWDTSDKESEKKCDLLEVYSDMDKNRLKENVTANWLELENNDISKGDVGKIDELNDDIVFGYDDRSELLQEMKKSEFRTIQMNPTTTNEQHTAIHEDVYDFMDI